jgi:hypothetical protein
MARMTDLPVAQAKRYAELECPSFAKTPWVNGPPWPSVAIVSSAGLVVEENGRSVRATGREIELGPERSSLRNQERKPEETSMRWYVSYRTGRSTIMHIFKRRSRPSLPRTGFSIAATVMRSKSGRCREVRMEKCSTSETSASSGKNRWE